MVWMTDMARPWAVTQHARALPMNANDYTSTKNCSLEGEQREPPVYFQAPDLDRARGPYYKTEVIRGRKQHDRLF